MLVVVARWYVHEGKDDEVADILKTAVRNSRAEPGCRLFMANRSIDDPRRFVMYEQFDDLAAFEAHQQTDSFKTNILQKILPLIESRSRELCGLIEP